MVEVFLDTDVCIDLLSGREPFVKDGLELLDHAEQLKFQLVISESCIPNLIYFLYETYKISDAEERLIAFINSCKLISGNKSIALLALGSSFKDKEDAFQYYIALQNGVDYFITRNIRDCQQQADLLPIFTPDDFIKKVVLRG